MKLLSGDGSLAPVGEGRSGGAWGGRLAGDVWVSGGSRFAGDGKWKRASEGT